MDGLQTVFVLGVVTFALGILLGFIGAGGAGLTVALLTSGFDLSVHQAIGTALAAMVVATVLGGVSHYREGNVVVGVGIVAGLGGVFGAALGARIGQDIPEAPLQIAAGLGLWLLAVLVWIRLRYARRLAAAVVVGDVPDLPPPTRHAAVAGLGLAGGAASAFLGVGMTPFLQLGMLVLLKMPLRLTVGTTMLTLMFISVSGAVSFAAYGDVSAPHLLGLVIGLGPGSFVGARFTGRARGGILRFAVVATPFLAGTVLLFA